MLSTTLYPPSLPQMESDGAINLAEITSSGIVINVNEYTTAKPGDLIELWFESYNIGSIGLAKDPVSQYFPWQCNIAPGVAKNIKDGVYKIQYNVIDAAQNSSWSDIGKAIIDRTSTGTLPPPTFPEAGADNTITYDEAMSDGGTPVAVPAYSGISAGDNVTVYWAGLKGNNVVQQSITKVLHTVQENELNGFTVLIANTFIVPGALDSARAWYVVQHTDTRNERSANSLVNIDISSGVMLPAPVFIEGTDGWIDAEECISDNGTEVTIPAYTGIGVGDKVNVHWQGFSQDGSAVAAAKFDTSKEINSADLAEGFNVNIPSEKLIPVGIGYGICYYDVIFANATTGISLTAQVNVDAIHTQWLPAPLLPEALDDGLIDENDAMSDGGTLITVAYQPMNEGDSVTIYWSGYQDDNTLPVNGTVYSATRSISTAEAASGTLSFTVPSKYITPIMRGYAVVSYSVQFITGGKAQSESTIAAVDTQGGQITGSSYLGGSTGFAPWDNTVIQGCYIEYLALDNSVPLRNTEVIFTLFGNNYFTNNHLNTVKVKTDLNGYARTNISGSDTSVNTITAEIANSEYPISTLSFETERTNEYAVPYLTSAPYIPGSGNRKFTLSVSQNSGTFKLSVNNNADIYVNGINKGGTLDKVLIHAEDPFEFEVSTNNLNNTAVIVSRVAPETGSYCTFYF